MRRRLTLAVLALVVATLVVTTAGSLLFVRRAAVSTSQQELVGQAAAISRTITDGTFPTTVSLPRELEVLRRAGDFDQLVLVELHSDGTIVGQLPAGLTPAQLNVPALLAGEQTAGHTARLLVFTAVPTPIPGVTAYTPLLVVTRHVTNPTEGLRYFLLVGAAALAAAALVAAALARRFSRPLVAAAEATRRIAAGDLTATVARTGHDDPEFVQLAASIDAMAGALGRARDQERQFLLSVSHELRTPLTSIQGYAEAIEDGTAPDPAAAASVIAHESRRLERLVQDVLDLARLDAHRFSLSVGPVDAAEVTRRVADGFRPRAEELGLALDVTTPSGAALWVEADPDRLAQIVANLVENASGFATGRVTLGAAPVGGTPTLWVVDDGPGIAPDELGRVFERHYTSDRVPGRRAGSGLGLAIVAELSAAMGASVTAESPVEGGRGTRMVLRLRPAATVPEPPPQARPPAAPDPPPAPDRTPTAGPGQNETATGSTRGTGGP